MKISGLAERAGVALSTLKYYQREGLVPEGVHRNANQVDYDETHVQRLRLIRALLEVGGLSMAGAKDVLRTLDDAAKPLAETFEIAQAALARRRPSSAASTTSTAARSRVHHLAQSRGWCISDENPGLEVAAEAIEGMLAIKHEPSPEYLDAYADAAEAAARADLQALSLLSEQDQIAELMVVGTVLGDPLFAGLRRLAQQDATREMFSTTTTPQEPPS
ncbi:MerR family transcriptional regulator [Lapillicoccus sp.]|uniref:MerR family transcriptional regulator n=1 Tax=Lapillicoccus sp. TaxID=1909287 RepID=UPI0027CBA8A1|nr:MerR family transcriptional regulator [Actinomycetota bacterium]